MPSHVKKYHGALRHGAYSATGILPGENPAEFQKLHRDLIAELQPVGALENEVIASLARLVWRKKNLGTLKIAEDAQDRHAQIIDERVPQDEQIFPLSDYRLVKVDPAEREAATRAAEYQARKELGDAYEFVEIGKIASIDSLTKDLDVQERLDAMIDKCLKRLLFLRGLKTVSSVQPPTTQKRLMGPSRPE